LLTIRRPRATSGSISFAADAGFAGVGHTGRPLAAIPDEVVMCRRSRRGLRRVSGDGGSRTHDLLVASEALCHQSFVPMRTGGVEPPQREAAGLQPVELADAQRPRFGGLGLLNWGGRTDSNRYLRGSQPRMLRYTTATMIITGTTGLEPASSRLTSERSARLSYAPGKVARVGFEPTVSSS
jgi:hypothetical protein